MKILTLDIFDKENNKIRSLAFNKEGISFVFGNVNKKEKNDTSNSIGKTVCLKFINYIFGCNSDSTLSKISGYCLKSEISFNNKKYVVSRTIGEDTILVDNKPFTLENYKKFFDINRENIRRTILLSDRKNILSILPYPSKEDYLTSISLLNFDTLLEICSEIYEKKEEVSSLDKSISDDTKRLGIRKQDIDETIFINEKKIKEINDEIAKINVNLKEFDLNQANSDLLIEFEQLNREIKQYESKLFDINIETESLQKSVKVMQEKNISSAEIKNIFKIAKIELNDLVIKRLEDVESFYKKVYSERIEKTNVKIQENKRNINILENSILDKKTRLKDIGKVLSNNEAYQNSLNLISFKNKELNELMFIKGTLNHTTDLLNKRSVAVNNLKALYEKLTLEKENLKSKISKLTDFVYSLNKEVYGDNISAYFNVNFSDYSLKNKPVTFTLSLSRDNGEGVNNVKNLFFDLLLFKFSNKSPILIEDSACFSGIDPRQVDTLLKLIKKISLETRKQAIVSINKYQICSQELVNEIMNSASVILNENNFLLKTVF